MEEEKVEQLDILARDCLNLISSVGNVGVEIMLKLAMQ
jgi:hypothetical protein